MRRDMHEVLIERPRSGLRRKTHRGNKPHIHEWTGEDSFAGSYRPRQHRSKYFDDLISPLRRWLRGQVDRPWDKVWSELSAGIDARSTVGQHLLDHVRGEVTLHCDYDLKQRCAVERLRVDHRSGQPIAVTGLYVDPRNGLLRWKDPRSIRRMRSGSPAESDEVVANRGNTVCIKLKGNWFDAEISPLPPNAKSKTPFDLQWQGQRFVVLRKRSLNSNELKDYALKNDDDA